MEQTAINNFIDLRVNAFNDRLVAWFIPRQKILENKKEYG